LSKKAMAHFWHTLACFWHVFDILWRARTLAFFYAIEYAKKVFIKEALIMHFIANEIPLAEREGELWEASRQYMSGEIRLEDLEAVERNYASPPDVAIAQSKIISKSKQSKKHYSLLHFLENLWLKLWRRV
jgi:hypothetical protein